MSISRLIIGMILLIAGIFFIILSILAAWWFVFYGIILVGLGIALLLNKHEDKIEKRKDLKEKEYKQ
jgi:predicted tellurium resistance membrane protein TerC